MFVPEAYTHPAASQTPLRGGPLFNIAVMGFAVLCHSGWACGIGRRLLDELAAKVRGGVGRTGTLASSDAFHEQYAKAEGTYRAARAFIYETWGEVNDTLDRGERLSVRQHTMIRLALHTCHVGLPRRGAVRLHLRRHRGAALGRAPATLPRHARRHAAHHVGAAGDSQHRPGTGRLASGKSWILDLVDQA